MRFFIIGYMTSGKTTLGREFAEKKGIPFLDLDACIEERVENSISEIFATRGEVYFREVERQLLHDICEKTDNFVLATGGGTPCFFDNMDYMNRVGYTLFLDIPFPLLVERLKTQRTSRPLLANYSDEELVKFVRKHLDARLPFYRKAKERRGVR